MTAPPSGSTARSPRPRPDLATAVAATPRSPRPSAAEGTRRRARSLDELPAAGGYLLDVSPWALPGLAGRRLPLRYVRRLHRYRPGPGVFKLDYALSGPVPWRDEACRRAGTVHLGGTMAEIAAALTAISPRPAPARPLLGSAPPSLAHPSP